MIAIKVVTHKPDSYFQRPTMVFNKLYFSRFKHKNAVQTSRCDQDNKIVSNTRKKLGFLIKLKNIQMHVQGYKQRKIFSYKELICSKKIKTGAILQAK